MKERVINKLKYLALVNVWTNEVNGWNYFKYYKIDFFKLKSFDKFIELIENGTMKLVIKVGIYLDEKRYGKTYDHGCGFTISDNDLCKLFFKCDV